MSNLMIVESPTKARKIKSFLGPGWDVRASLGHVRDLPQRSLSVDPDTYALTYEVIPGKASTIAALRAAVKAADCVYLASDPDREGEAIAWHLQTLLRLKNPKRVTFHEITKGEVAMALAAPTTVNAALVAAQEARRALDRLVGYKVSSALRRKTGRALSAGRVQTIGVRLIVDREEAIAAFVPTDHYAVVLTFADGVDGKPWTALWDFRSLVPEGQTLWTDAAFATRVAALRDTRAVSYEETVTYSAPPPAFTTSTFQQAASNRLRLGARAAMKAAQQLFEDGYITYHRTDSAELSDVAFAAIVAYGKAHGLPVRTTKRIWKAKASAVAAQGAHEAIRPTNVALENCGLGGNLQRVYTLIRSRALASQMRDAEYDVRTLVLESREQLDGKPMTFVARGRTLRFAGWRLIDGNTKDDPAAANPVPALAPGTAARALDGQMIAKQTEPPPRYTEASLIKELEERGVGRPSTYDSIIEVIQARGYVELKERKFFPLPLGVTLIGALRTRFAFVEVAFTAAMEQHLDAIAEGTARYLDVVRDADTQLQTELTAFAGVAMEAEALETAGACPTCGIGVLTKRHRRATPGKSKKSTAFWTCSRRECTGIRSDVNGKPDLTPPIEGGQCPKCTTHVLIRHLTAGRVWWGCSGYRKGAADSCDASYPDAGGKPSLVERAPAVPGGPCPACKGGILYRRSGTRGFFWSCSHWNRARNKCAIKLADLNGKPDLASFHRCACKDGSLVRRSGPKGPFWGCSTFPKCKRTARDRDGAPELAA
jgi:DNA topoisomerase-1